MSEQADRDALAELLAELLEDLYQRLRDGEDCTAYAIGAIEAIEDRLPDLLAQRDRRVRAEALREFADRFRPGDGNPWALHVRSRARRSADRVEAGE